jgi:predicted DNA-binding transcriptional regulator YafY
MSRSSHRERTTRLNAARALLNVHKDLSAAADALVSNYQLSKRQAYRYLEEARYVNERKDVGSV